MKKKAPTWARFLEVRRELIEEWRREGQSCTEIARTLSMDPGQVFLISRVEDDNNPPADALGAIRGAAAAGEAALRKR